MQKDFIIKLKNIKKRHKKIESMLIDKNIISDQKKFCLLLKEYNDLNNVTNTFIQWEKNQNQIKETQKIINDPEIYQLAKEDLYILQKKKNKIEKKLKYFFSPKNINDKRNCYMEIHAGTGGDEAAIFAGDLLKMYIKYAEIRRWNIEIINMHNGEHGGYKEILIKIIGLNAYKYLQFESGGHRVQRIPNTESQGRIHTSTCIIAVMPELLENELPNINLSDLKIDTFRSSGAGGQHVNTTDSAIRITHVPTGVVVACQDERSQHKNKAKALKILRSRIKNIELTNRESKKASQKKNLLGSGYRSDRNRTYNFPQGRITDHRINFTMYRLNDIMSGKLDLLIDKILNQYYTEV